MAYGAPPQARDFVAAWTDIGKPALAKAGGGEAPGGLAKVEAEVVRLSIANLMTFPWIKQAVEAGRLAVQGYIFDIHNGVLSHVTADSVEPVE